MQQASNWEQTRRKLGLRRTSLGSLSEAAGVFDAKYLRAVVQELACQALPLVKGREAGIVRDVVISRLGTAHHKNYFPGQSLRLVIVRTEDRDGPREIWLLTDRLDLSAALVALAYRHRWSVELFFRWLKCVLGARHFVSHQANGVALQMYAAMIVSLLITLHTGRKPTKRTFEIIQFYLAGWVSDAEFDAHLASLKKIES